jgi:putative membrane protein
MFLSEQEKHAIAEAIRKAESTTSGEIVFAVSDSSGGYRHATFQGALSGMALMTALYLLAPVVHTIGMVLWVELVSFALFYVLIPWIPWRRWFISGAEMESRVQEAAYRQFYSSGLYKTRESNGVLIYLSLLERRVVVLGDTAIHERMGDPHWEGVRDRIIQGIRLGRACEGICAAIQDCGQALAQHFPHRADDRNELPDQVIDHTSEPGVS